MKIHLLALMLISVAALWGWTFVIVDEAISTYGVIGFLAVRFTIGAAVLGAVAARRMNLATMRVGMSIGVVLTVAYLLQTLGLKYTTPANCGLITGLFVVFTPLAARLLFGVKTSGKFWLAIGIGVPYTIHITHRYQEDRQRFDNPEEAIHSTTRHTGGALAGSAFTTVAGFGILVTSSLVPFQQFGAVTVYAISFALIAAVLVLPSMLVLWDRWHRNRGEEIVEHRDIAPIE